MKNKHRPLPKLAFALTIFMTLGCGVASQIFAIATPTPTITPSSTTTPSPTITPTRTPTLTPTPLPDISAARILLEELPAGFEELPAQELGMEDAASDEEAMQPEVTFAFQNPNDFQLILGMDFLLVKGLDRAGFGYAINHPDEFLEQVVNSLGAQEIREEKLLTGLEDVGEMRVAMSMIAESDGIPVQVEMILFRRDIVGGMIASITLEGETPSISLHDLARLLDQHIQESLGIR